VIGRHCDPHARRELDGQTLHHDRSLEGPEEALSDVAREVGVGVGQQHPELAPAQTGHPLLVADRVDEPPRQVVHDLVRVVVAERVHRVPEPVEGEDDEGQGASRLVGGGESGAQAKLHEVAVGQAGEAVEEAYASQALLGQLLLRDVLDEAANESGPTVGSGQDPPLVAPPDDGPLPVEEAVLGDEARARLTGFPVAREHLLPILGVEPVRPHRRLGEPLARGVSGHRQQLRAHVGHAAHLVRPADVGEGRDLLDQGAVVVLGIGLRGRRAGLPRHGGGRADALALDRRGETPHVTPADTVVKARLHEADDLVIGERLGPRHGAWRVGILPEHLDHPLRAQVRVRVAGQDDVAGSSGEPAEVALDRGERQRGLVAALLEVRGDSGGRAGRVDHRHGPQRFPHGTPVCPRGGRAPSSRSE
jgi:hypothetical protein